MDTNTKVNLLSTQQLNCLGRLLFSEHNMTLIFPLSEYMINVLLAVTTTTEPATQKAYSGSN